MTFKCVGASALLLGTLVGAALSPAGAHVVTLSPVRDGTLIEDAAGAKASGSGPALFVGMNSGGARRRGVVAFDVATTVPKGSLVQSATLTLSVSNVSNSSLSTISLHRVLAGWGEGSSASSGGSGAASEPGDATWIHRFYPDSLWARAGGDFVEASSGAVGVTDVGGYSWSGDGLVGDVQFWVDHPEVDFGWLFLGDETVSGSAKRFDSRECLECETRPLLTITYTPPDVPVRPVTWSGLKTRYRPCRCLGDSGGRQE